MPEGRRRLTAIFRILSALAVCAGLLPSTALGQNQGGQIDPPPGSNALRVDGDIQLLSTNQGSFMVPIYIRHSPDVDAVHIGLDYDELLLRFNDNWTIEGAVGQPPPWMLHDPQKGTIEIVVPFDPEGPGTDAEVPLIYLEFFLQPLGQGSPFYGYRANGRIGFDDRVTSFIRRDDGETQKPDLIQGGSIGIYFTNAIEVGSARISPDRQTFRIPLYVTHVGEEPVSFSMGLDYDEVFLDLIDVKPVSSRLNAKSLRFTQKRDGERCTIEVRFGSGVFPSLLREHLLDLEFEYRQDGVAPPQNMLQIIPGPVEGQGGESSLEIRQGILFLVGPRFIRGDTDGSGSIGLSDALTILRYLTGGRRALCREALDVDADGQIDLTDAIQVLSYLYLGGAPPAAPFPEPGPSADEPSDLGCDQGFPEFELLPLPGGM